MKHIVLDTGFLVNLLGVDGRSNDEAKQLARTDFECEIEKGTVFYVPVPVVFEFCNFVAQVKSGGSRRALAKELRNAISSSLESSVPWTITPFEGDDSMRDWVAVLNDALTEFNQQYAQQQIGLTDIAVIRQARILKKVTLNTPLPRPLVHIWTTDEALKSHEPDSEPVK